MKIYTAESDRPTIKGIIMYNPEESCYLCGSTQYDIIHIGVRGATDVNVLKCHGCGLVRLSRFITDHDSFYEKSGMWQSNGMASNVCQARIDALDDDSRRAEFVKNYVKNMSVLDFGCGSGGFLHCIRHNRRFGRDQRADSAAVYFSVSAVQ